MSAPALETIGEVEGEDIFDVEEEAPVAALQRIRSSGRGTDEFNGIMTPQVGQPTMLPHASGDADSGSDSEADDMLEDAAGADAGRAGSHDMQGFLQASGSARSSTMNASLEDSSVLAASEDADLAGSGRTSANRAIPSSAYRPSPSRSGVTQSLPVTSHVRMGSSVPISIPFMGARPIPSPAHRRTADDDGSDQEDFVLSSLGPGQGGNAGGNGGGWGTFIPPHKLSQRDDNMFSLFSGESPAVALKREKLRQRNQILRSTGFLEAGANRSGRTIAAGAPGAAATAAAAAMQQAVLSGLGSPATSLSRESGGLSRAMAAGGLSKALCKS